MVSRRAQRLLDFGAAIALIAAGWGGAHHANVSVAAASEATQAAAVTAVHEAIRVEIGPLRHEIAELALAAEHLDARIGQVEGHLAALPSPATQDGL